MKKKRLIRSRNRMIAGVCAGIAEYMDTDPTVIRLVWMLVTIFTAFLPGMIAYIAAWVIIPEK